MTLFCPACQRAGLQLTALPRVRIIRGPTFVSLEHEVVPTLACRHCSFTVEVDEETGELKDVVNLNLADLVHPNHNPMLITTKGRDS